MDIWQLILNALPEAIGGLIAVLVVAVAGYLFRRFTRQPTSTPAETKAEVPAVTVELTKLSTPEIPQNLPPRGEFIGREREKAEVREALASRSYLVCIDGIGGIGKTALALEVTHECLRASKGEMPANGVPTFDAFVWTTAKDRELALSDILDTIARTLDYPYIAQLPPEEKPPEAAKLLRAQKCLLIVDNFETITDDTVRDFLLNLPEPSKVLVTSREQKLRQARAISLRGMEQGEALALIRSEGSRLGLPTVEGAEEKVLLRLYEATGGAPLAIKWAVGQMKQRGQSLDTVLEYLYEARGDIFESIFARSWRLLSENAGRVLMVMPIFATSALKEAIEAASDVHKWDLDEALGQLVEMWLVEASGELDEAKRRYSIHPLTRSFAGARLFEVGTFGQEAWLRLATHYIERCSEMGKWGHTAGFPWFEAELPNILAVIEWANRAREWNTVTSIFINSAYFLGTRGYWQERIKYGQMALKAAEQTGDRSSAAVCQHALGWILLRQGRYLDAEALVQSCIRSCIDLGRKKEAAWALITLAKVAVARGDLDRARQVVDKAIAIVGEAGYESVAHGLLTTQGRIELQLGNLEAARNLLLAALEATKRAGSGGSISSRQIDLGHVALAQNQLDEAASYFKSALESSRQFLRQDNIAKAEFGLARTHALLGNTLEAAKLALSAREQFVRMGMEYEVYEVDTLLRQIGNEAGGEAISG
jgi:tetratricopeptide (TPR) repeat protein